MANKTTMSNLGDNHKESTKENMKNVC